MATLLTILGVLLLITILICYSTFSWGFVLMKFWVWFLLPIFPTLPYINFWQSIGLILFMSLFAPSNKKSKDMWYTIICTPWITLFIGWIIYLCIR